MTKPRKPDDKAILKFAEDVSHDWMIQDLSSKIKTGKSRIGTRLVPEEIERCKQALALLLESAND